MDSFVENVDTNKEVEKINSPKKEEKSENYSNYEDMKSVTEQISAILTTMPENGTDFSVKKMDWSKSESEINGRNATYQDNSSRASSSDTSSTENEDDESEADSSELDEEDCARRRSQCLDEMTTIEKQFMDIRDQLYRERHTQIMQKLDEVNAGTAPEYLQQLLALETSKQVRMQVSDIYQRLRLNALKTNLEAETQANAQHLKNEKQILMGRIEFDLSEKMHRLEEDRENVDLSNQLWGDGRDLDPIFRKKKKKEEVYPSFSFGGVKRKKKPVTVTGPYIVYMLRDCDIMEDWTAIKRAIVSKRRTTSDKIHRKRHACKYLDGKVIYGIKTFEKGQHVTVRKRGESPTLGKISGINPTEILVERTNGSKAKLYIHQLQRGVYTLQHR
uniref:Breast cancer metastasis-suppressor 1-like protein n=1 Tax=Ciona savignyi TaxID=51511 RepID=H2YSR5_CIOSA